MKDYKKESKELYLPKIEPSLIRVPKMTFIMVNGKGDPNVPNGEFSKAMEILYGLTYTIKMSYKGEHKIKDYFEYVVPPLEGLWWNEDNTKEITDKSKFNWVAMIRQPEFVTEEVFEWAVEKLSKKKPELDLSKARLEVFQEGLCVQVMHIGPFDLEKASVEKIEKYVLDNNLEEDFEERHHHEIYLGDPRKTDPSKLRTIVRHPVKNRGEKMKKML